MSTIDTVLREVVVEQPYPLIFATISGAHLYGFPSPDSDYDLRGVHVLPLTEIVGLNKHRETIEISADRAGIELDLVTHEMEKFCRLLLRPNGYVLEQLCSPLVVHTNPIHAELKTLVPQLVTRRHAHHYLGFAETQWRLFEKEHPQRVKPLLYVFRVLLTGIHLMRTGEIEANLVTLNNTYKLSYLPELVARKLSGPEQSTLDGADIALFTAEYTRLRSELEAAQLRSHLPAEPGCWNTINDLLVQVRLGDSG